MPSPSELIGEHPVAGAVGAILHDRDWLLGEIDEGSEAKHLTVAGHDVFLPQIEVKAITSLDADTIFRVDVNGVRSAEAVVAILDGADPDSGRKRPAGPILSPSSSSPPPPSWLAPI